MKRITLIVGFHIVLLVRGVHAADEIPPIARRIPPAGIELPQQHRDELNKQLQATVQRTAKLNNVPLASDVEVFTKAVDYALRHGEFYNEKEIPRAYELLKHANLRIDQLLNLKARWTTKHGLVVRGYRSSIDDSIQPYGLEIPDDLDLNKKVPLYVWLHGRGDKITDLHFIHQRMSRPGRIAPAKAIVLHPFGRHCMGFKSAGEIDVLESIARVSSQYKIDQDRIVLMGFSMGGAGVWHLGAHYTDRWVAMSPGAGFAETAQYNRLEKVDYPAWYEQKLWGTYDAPGYVRNLFNLPVVAYSGELDKQIQAARVMETAFLAHDKNLPHVIGPGMGHKYHPDSLKEIMSRMDDAVQAGLNRGPSKISLQTRTLRYNKIHWLSVLGLEEHWRDSQVDAEIHESGDITVTSKNVTSLSIARSAYHVPRTLTINGQKLAVPDSKPSQVLILNDKKWTWQKANKDKLTKSPGLQGPIDDAFLDPFLVVTPATSKNTKIQHWVEFELKHFVDRWRSLYRGEVRQKPASRVTAEDIKKYNLVLWGDPTSNRIIRRLIDRLPIEWTEEQLRVGGKSYDTKTHAPMLIYPNPENSTRYIVLNSGPTHREGHDRTNSLQNPKLPDWAVIDIRQTPDAFTPGKVVDADFFDEQWKFKKR